MCLYKIRFYRPLYRNSKKWKAMWPELRDNDLKLVEIHCKESDVAERYLLLWPSDIIS